MPHPHHLSMARLIAARLGVLSLYRLRALLPPQPCTGLVWLSVARRFRLFPVQASFFAGQQGKFAVGVGWCRVSQLIRIARARERV